MFTARNCLSFSAVSVSVGTCFLFVWSNSWNLFTAARQHYNSPESKPANGSVPSVYLSTIRVPACQDAHFDQCWLCQKERQGIVLNDWLSSHPCLTGTAYRLTRTWKMATDRLGGPNYGAQEWGMKKIKNSGNLTTLHRKAFVYAQVRQFVKKNILRKTMQSHIERYWGNKFIMYPYPLPQELHKVSHLRQT